MMVLGLDCGSTNLKAAVFDPSLRRLGEASEPTPYLTTRPDCMELPPTEVCTAVRHCVRAACALAGVGERDLDVLALTSQAQTFTISDAHGAALCPFISWIDQRAEAEAEAVHNAIGAGFHRHCSFPVPVPQLLLPKLLWLRRHRPELFGEGARVVHLPTFIAARLTGVEALDDNLAAMSGLYSLQGREWWPEALQLAGLTPANLSRVVALGRSCVGVATAPADGLPPGIATVFAGNDQTSGAFGNDCTEGEIIVTLGTALVAYRVAGPEPGPFCEQSAWGPYPGGLHYELATRGEGCLAVDLAREILFPGVDMAGFLRAAEEGEHGLSEEAPFFFPRRVRESTAWLGPAHRAKRAFAVLEGVTFELMSLVGDMAGGETVSAVRGIGGGSRSDLWLQLIADALALPVRRGTGDSLRGAARMALGEGTAGRAGEGDDTVRFMPRRAPGRLLQSRYRKWVSEAQARGDGSAGL